MKIIQQSLAIMLAMFMSLSVWANDGATDEDPKVVIENTVKQIIEALDAREDKSILTEKDRDNIRQAIEGRFDYHDMARRSLGKPWKKLSDEEQSHFTDVYRELLERSYGNRLAEYNGQKVVFAKAKLNKKKTKAKVKSKVIDGTRVTPVDYSLHRTDTGWQVRDIKIEGASMVKTKFEDYKPMLKKSGYDQLLKALEDQLVRLKAKDAS